VNNIKDRVIVITGAARGFGQLVAFKAAKLGAQIVAVDINEDGLEDTLQTILSDDGRAIFCHADVTNADDMVGVMNRAIEAFGRVDVLVNNAGIMPLAFLSDHAKAMEAWSRCIDINFKGVLNGIAAAATGLSATVIDPNASIGSLGIHMKDYVNRITSIFEGNGQDEWADSESIEYLMLSPDLLAEQIIYAINQPWGVSISDITVRASGDMFLI